MIKKCHACGTEQIPPLEWHARRYEAGLCTSCGKYPHEPDRVRCAGCLARARKDAIDRDRARNGTRGRVMRCGLCKTEGHERRVCPRRS